MYLFKRYLDYHPRETHQGICMCLGNYIEELNISQKLMLDKGILYITYPLGEL